MAARRTRVTLSIPWNDEEAGHPAGWGYDVLLGLDDPDGRLVNVIATEEVDEHGNIIPESN